MNPVVISVCIMLLLALMRVNVVVALTFSAIVGGLVSGMSLNDSVAAFESGLGGGATIALSYAMLGTFAVAISKSGIGLKFSPVISASASRSLSVRLASASARIFSI